MDSDNQGPASKDEYLRSGEAESAQQQNNGPVQSPITQQAFERRRPVFNPMGRIEDINVEEVKIADIRRHFFGLFLIYLATVVAVALSLGLIVILAPSVLGTGGLVNTILSVGSLVVILMAVIFMVLASKIYNANQIIITDVNVTQVLQIGLFNRKVSELTMENIEDVTANQSGVFPTIFNYGTLVIETAGEQNNFTFKYCPNPNAYAKALQDARGEYQRKHMPGGHHSAPIPHS